MTRAPDRDAGGTLVETLVAVTILGIAFTAIVGGMYTSAVASDANRKQATATANLTSYAEAVKGDAYVACASSYPGSGYTVPTGYAKGTVSVAYWDAATSTFVATCATDPGLQRVSLSIQSTDGRGTVSVQFGKRKP